MFINLSERRREKEGEREGGREGEKHQLVASHMRPDWGPNKQSWYVPWPGIEPSTFWCMGQHSNQLSHTGQGSILYDSFKIGKLFPTLKLWGRGKTHLFSFFLPFFFFLYFSFIYTFNKYSVLVICQACVRTEYVLIKKTDLMPP